jgi:hypothetical protein
MLRDLPPARLVMADRAHDTDTVRQQIEAQDAPQTSRAANPDPEGRA